MSTLNGLRPRETEPKDTLRQTVVLVSAILAVVGAFVGSGAAGGTPIQDAAGGALAADATLIAPGGPAFAIWTPIYIGLLAYALWQSLPGQRADARQRKLGYPIAASLLLNAAWILSIQFGFLALSVPVIAALLAVLVWSFLLTLQSRPKNIFEAVIADGTIGLYLGWVCVATAANITALLVAANFSGFGVESSVWAVFIIAVTALIGVLIAVHGHGRFAPAASLAWGLAWVAVARFTGPLLSTPTGTAAVAAALIVVVTTAVLRVRRPLKAADSPAPGSRASAPTNSSAPSTSAPSRSAPSASAPSTSAPSASSESSPR